ncbi:NTPase [Neisseria sp. HMSC066H01]|uniref:KAP family P-loop NTPase fold protein n=1 Tax=unclassified Neisseria TaxID=2623750 RepID=UPI0008A22D00|nr:MULTISPECIES: KAP family NTPase [unclassified Neisseria]OFR92830.1 NTPase [Neisseria sp. HMSC063B05]OHQ24195.1 NTPase [Neisseria sp. HMSC066H01]
METQTLEKPTFDTQDEFKRKPIAENIIRLLTSPIDLSPMVIDGGWGTGKTEFCQKLIRLMQQQHPDYQPVYIDAFRSDHSGEPLLALLAEIIKTCTPPKDSDEKLIEEHKDRIRKITKAAGFLMKTVAKAAVGHVLKQNTDDLAEELQQIMNNDQEADSLAETVTDAAATIASHTIDATVEALLKEQIEAEKNLETLKACLKELAADKPIILFIDELDRCRPDYAVDMLEVIKHVFDVENVKVVLVTNTKQLRAAINHRYGVEVDAHKYLDKFLKYSFALPDKVVARFEEERALVAVEHFKQLIRKSRWANELKDLIDERSPTINFISDMIERNNISLRETERLVRFLEIYHSLSGGLDKVIWQYALLRITGVFIFCFYPNLMDDINKNCAYSKDFAQIFNIQALSNIPKNSSGVIYTRTNVIAMMLILNSQMDTHFNFNNLHDLSEWQKYMNEAFLDNGEIFPPGMNGVLSILKETFRVLSFEQTPQ